MPWHIESDNPDCSGYAVVKDSDGSVAGCHESKEDAEAQLAALYANESGANMNAFTIDPGMLELRAASCRQNPRVVPVSDHRPDRACLAQWRTETVDRNGKLRDQLVGYASIVDRGYEMWDVFGPYSEIISKGAFDDTLSGQPDVNFLVNHTGLSMARTTNGTLELTADALGLRSVAYVNRAERRDVQDLMTAIEDRDVTEMSFAFRIDEGHWSDDATTFYIDRIDLDRGDVSAVNYGANPFTSIAARAHQIIESLDQLPAGAARAALERLQARADMRFNAMQPLPADQRRAGSVDQNGMAESDTTDRNAGRSAPLPSGPSVELIKNLLLLEKEE